MAIEILLWILAVVLIVVGAAGTILPVLPGPPLVLVGLFLGAWIGDFEQVSWGSVIFFTVLTALSLLIDFVAASVGVKGTKASTHAAVGAAVGTVIGIVFGLAGLVLGPFVGAALGEYYVQRDLRRATGVGLAAWLGIILGSAAKLAVVFGMIAWFVVALIL